MEGDELNTSPRRDSNHPHTSGEDRVVATSRVPHQGLPPWWLTAGWAALGLVLLAWFAPAKLGFALLCPLRTLTGVPCPTCGATHTVMLLLQADIFGALRCNPLFALAGIALAGVCLVGTSLWLVGYLPAIRLGKKGLRLVRIVTVLAVAANWLYLLITTG